MYKVMLVDDEYMILNGLTKLISWKELGFEVVQLCRSGEEALIYLQSETVDLVITDITMPEMTGIELIQKMKQLNYPILTIILSGYAEFSYVQQAMTYGVKNYLLKPIDREELKQILAKIKQELSQQSSLLNRQTRYIEMNLIRWLNDELSEKDFYDTLTILKIKEKPGYLAIKIEAQEQELTQIVNDLKAEGQVFIIESYIQKNQTLFWIYQGSTHELNRMMKSLAKRYKCELLVGEFVQSWEKVYESVKKIEQLTMMKQFYPNLLRDKEQIPHKLDSVKELSYLKFNEALMIGDRQTITKELHSLFTQMKQNQLHPQEVRYASFFLIADLLTQYPKFKKDLDKTILNKIQKSQDVWALETLLVQIIHQIQTTEYTDTFSENVQKIVGIVQQKYQQDLTLKYIAEQLHLNVVYLGQLFKKEVNLSFAQYLNQVRVKKAQQLLLETALSVNEISEKVGYNNTNYFSKLFKKLNGYAPKEFREAFKSGRISKNESRSEDETWD